MFDAMPAVDSVSIQPTATFPVTPVHLTATYPPQSPQTPLRQRLSFSLQSSEHHPRGQMVYAPHRPHPLLAQPTRSRCRCRVSQQREQLLLAPRPCLRLVRLPICIRSPRLALLLRHTHAPPHRSEERRVGKECR